MSLTENQKKHLRRLGHALKPVVRVGGKGPSEAVAAELDRALADHELVKVQARVGDRVARDEALALLAARTGAALVQQIGNVGLFYRENKKLRKVLLPDS